jgi:predicted DNA-binding transcriptional regulator YafY
MTVTVAGIIEIRPWILSWGDGVEVLAPDSLRTSVADAVRAAAARYRG